jgi:protein-S-isoprenylcysteine O-methyltransferase Ste14
MQRSAESTCSSVLAAESGWKQRAFEFLVRHRVRLSVFVFVALMLEDVLGRHKPRDLANFHDPFMLFGLGLIVGGLALRSWAAGTLRKMAHLTTEGPYAIVRNPLYIGSFMMMVGFCNLIHDAENIYFVLGPMLLVYVFKVFSEERMLANKFGGAWQDYAARVPRFVPRRWPHGAFEAWNFRQWLGSREYRALAGGLLGLIAIELWRLS